MESVAEVFGLELEFRDKRREHITFDQELSSLRDPNIQRTSLRAIFPKHVTTNLNIYIGIITGI